MIVLLVLSITHASSGEAKHDDLCTDFLERMDALSCYNVSSKGTSRGVRMYVTRTF